MDSNLQNRVGGAEKPRPLTEPLVRLRKRLLMLVEPIYSLGFQ